MNNFGNAGHTVLVDVSTTKFARLMFLSGYMPLVGAAAAIGTIVVGCKFVSTKYKKHAEKKKRAEERKKELAEIKARAKEAEEYRDLDLKDRNEDEDEFELVGEVHEDRTSGPRQIRVDLTQGLRDDLWSR